MGLGGDETMTEFDSTTLRYYALLRAAEELMSQLEGTGIAIAGEDAGQWAGAEGLSFDAIRTEINKERNAGEG